MGWIDEERLNAGKRTWRQLREHKKRKEEGYHDVVVNGLDASTVPTRRAKYRYELIHPDVDPDQFRENIAYLLEDFEEFAAMADAARQGRAARRELPSLSKVKQLNPNFPK